MAKIPIILEAGRADGKLIKTNSIYDDNQEKFLSDKIKEIDDNHNNLNNTVNDLTDTVNNNELDIENKLEEEQNRATNVENNLRETINNITEISGSATTANIVTIDTIPDSSSSNVQQALNELFNADKVLNTTIEEEKAAIIGTDRIAEESVTYDKLQPKIKEVAENMYYVENSEFIKYCCDAYDKLIWWINPDGSIDWAKGIPSPIKTYLESIVSTKVDKIDGKGLIDMLFASSVYYIENKEWAYVILTSDERVLFGIKPNGDVFNGNKQEESNSNSQKRNRTSHQKLIGVIEWDGGVPTDWPDNKGMDEISNEQYQASSFYNSQYPTWREYVKSIYGKYPPMYCSFATFFNTHSEIEPSRQPLNKYYSETTGTDVELGWWQSGYTDEHGELHETEKIEAQIDMASNYGIDYFAMTFYCNSGLPDVSVFNEDDTINEIALKTFPANNFVYQYMSSRNKWKMRFCLILMHDDNLTKRHMYMFAEYVRTHFLNDPQYLYLNSAPLLLQWSGNPTIGNNSNIRFNGSHVLVRRGQTNIGSFDGLFAYGVTNAISDEHLYKKFAERNLNDWKSHLQENRGFCIVNVAAGRDDRGRWGYTKSATGDRDYVEMPTSEEFFDTLKASVDLTEKYGMADVSILIYAWNEFIEGGWLMPTQAEINSEKGFYKLEQIRDIKQYWINNY